MISDQFSVFVRPSKYQIDVPKSKMFPKLPISYSSHFHKDLTYTGTEISKILYGRAQFEICWWKCLTFHKAGRSKNLFKRGCMGCLFPTNIQHVFPNMFKGGGWSSVLKLTLVYDVQKQENFIIPANPSCWGTRAVPQYSSAQALTNRPNTHYHQVPWLRWHNVSWHPVFRLPEGWASICLEIWSSDMFGISSASGYVGENVFRNLVQDVLTFPQLVGT